MRFCPIITVAGSKIGTNKLNCVYPLNVKLHKLQECLLVVRHFLYLLFTFLKRISISWLTAQLLIRVFMQELQYEYTVFIRKFAVFKHTNWSTIFSIFSNTYFKTKYKAWVSNYLLCTTCSVALIKTYSSICEYSSPLN